MSLVVLKRKSDIKHGKISRNSELKILSPIDSSIQRFSGFTLYSSNKNKGRVGQDMKNSKGPCTHTVITSDQEVFLKKPGERKKQAECNYVYNNDKSEGLYIKNLLIKRELCEKCYS